MASMSTMSGGSAMSGVFSGIDSSVLITDSLKAYQIPINRLNTQKSDLQKKQGAINELSSRLAALQDLAKKLKDASKLASVAASSADTKIVTVSGTSASSLGNHKIEIDRLATSERKIHGGIAPLVETWTHSLAVATPETQYISADDISDASGGSFKFNFQFGTEAAVSVDLSQYAETGATLNDLVNKINEVAGYTAASAVSLDGQFSLRLQANAGGAAALTISNDDSVAALNGTSDFTRTTQGGLVSENSLVGAGQFVYSYKGVTRTILTTASTTLAGLRDLINKDASNPGISASLLQYDSGDGKALHLVLTGKDTGSDKGIAINDAATSLNGANGTMDFRSSSFSVVQAAQDARLRVDGYPQDDAWMTRSTNTIDDVLPGVTLNLQGSGSANVAVSRDNKQFKTDLGNLVAIYNGIMAKVQEYTGYDEENKLAGLLQGDNIVNMMISPIRSAFTSKAAGFTVGLDAYTTLADIGFSLDKDGQLSLDDTKLADALSRDYESVARLFSASGIGETNSEEIKFASAMDTTKAGDYLVKVTYDASGNAQAWVQGQNNSWREMTVVGNSLTGKFGNAEQGMSLTINWDSQRGAYTTTATVHLQQGMAGGLFETIKSLTDPADGIVKSKTDEYDSMMDAIDKNIELKERLLENRRVVLQAKYARLEALLASLDSQKGAIDSMMKALESSKKD